MLAVHQPIGITETQTAAGHRVRYATRLDTNDGALVGGILDEQEYPFGRMQGMSGWAVDAGAHIGIVTCALALDNPDLRIFAVEPVEENREILLANLRLNDLEERVEIVPSALGKDAPTELRCGYVSAGDEPAGYVHDNRWIGNIYHEPSMPMECEVRSVPGVSLTRLLATWGIDRLAFMKSDTEGAEWVYLADPAADRVDRIIGEWHGAPGLKGLRALLPTHRVTHLDFNDVNGLFEAVHR